MKTETIESRQEKKYLPAAGKNWLLPLYDPLTKLLGLNAFRKKLIDQMGIRSHHRILDVGCGTGTLILSIKKCFPDLDITGVDPDPGVLIKAKNKIRPAHGNIRLDRAFSDELPYLSGSFDRVFSSFVLHHVEYDKKEKTLCEIHRVLKSDGSFHMLDFEHWRQSEEEKKNPSAHLLRLMQKAGFTHSRLLDKKKTLLGPVAYYMAF